MLGELGLGVRVGSAAAREVGAAGVTPSGVAACNVANRSGVGAEAGRLHPAKVSNRKDVNKSRTLLVIQFDRFKAELLTGQNFCTVTSTIWTVNFFVQRMIF